MQIQLKMDYKCIHCSKLSNNMSEIIAHLKKIHYIVENDEHIKCLVNHRNTNVCNKSYLTYSGLKTHMKSCITLKKRYDYENSIILDELASSFETLSCTKHSELIITRDTSVSSNVSQPKKSIDNVNIGRLFLSIFQNFKQISFI